MAASPLARRTFVPHDWRAPKDPLGGSSPALLRRFRVPGLDNMRNAAAGSAEVLPA